MREDGKDVSVNPVFFFLRNTILTALNRVEVVNIVIFLRNTILTALSRVEVVNIVILYSRRLRRNSYFESRIWGRRRTRDIRKGKMRNERSRAKNWGRLTNKTAREERRSKIRRRMIEILWSRKQMIEIEGNGENSRISRLRFEGKTEKRNAIAGYNRAWRKTVMNCHKRP